MLEDLHPRTQWVSWNGVCASPTLAGKRIYLCDDCATTVVIEPGREYKRVAANTLENYIDAYSCPFSQEATYSSPVFEGKSMYYRTPGYLYCIREAGK
jgi:hypothetical protein